MKVDNVTSVKIEEMNEFELILQRYLSHFHYRGSLIIITGLRCKIEE